MAHPDPYERTGMYNGKDNGSIAYYNWFAFEFWRFVFAQQQIARAAQTVIDYPQMQRGASFNLEAVKEQVQRAWHRIPEIDVVSAGRCSGSVLSPI